MNEGIRKEQVKDLNCENFTWKNSGLDICNKLWTEAHSTMSEEDE